MKGGAEWAARDNHYQLTMVMRGKQITNPYNDNGECYANCYKLEGVVFIVDGPDRRAGSLAGKSSA